MKIIFEKLNLLRQIFLGGALLIASYGAHALVSVSGGEMVVNLDSDALAAAVNQDFDPNRRSLYVEEYFDPIASASRTAGQILGDHIVPGTGEIPTTNLQFAVNGSSLTNPARNSIQPTNFAFDPVDLAGTASGGIGLGGAIRYRIDVARRLDDNGEEIGNRVVTADFTLEYDASRIGGDTGHSGWVLFNHFGFRSDVFDLDNVEMNLTADMLELSGDLALATGFDHFNGTRGAIVGDFSFQTSVVPLPAAFWLFGAGLAGLGLIRGRNNEA